MFLLMMARDCSNIHYISQAVFPEYNNCHLHEERLLTTACFLVRATAIFIIGSVNLDSSQILQQYINTKRSLSLENSDKFEGIVKFTLSYSFFLLNLAWFHLSLSFNLLDGNQG